MIVSSDGCGPLSRKPKPIPFNWGITYDPVITTLGQLRNRCGCSLHESVREFIDTCTGMPDDTWIIFEATGIRVGVDN